MKLMKWTCSAAVLLAVFAVVCFWRNRSSVKTSDADASVVPASEVGVAATASAVAASAVDPAVALASLSSNQTASVRGTKPYVLTCERGIEEPLRLAVEAMGAKVVGSRSARKLVVEATPAVRTRLAADSRFSSVEEILPSAKIAPELAAAIKDGAKSVEASIVTLTPEDRRIVLDRIASLGGEVLPGCLNDGDTFSARLPAERVADLAANGDVRWLEKFVRPHFMNDMAVEPKTMNIRSIWKSEENPGGLSGAGQIVSTSDTGIDSGNLETLHEDLRDRVLGFEVYPGCNETDSNGHGTHTAGSIVGNGKKSDGKIRGTAWGANLYAWFSCGKDGHVYTPTSYDALFRNNGAWDAFIHSASWGSSTTGKYTSDCARMDKWVWEHPDFLPVYSAGNDGNYGSGTVGSPAAAKNILTVGATQNLRTGHDGGWGNGNPAKTASFSSRGPCRDGRIKPDIASPGVGVLSTRSHGVNYSYGNYDDFYAFDSGTSMSCPLTAGAVTLIREWLVRQDEYNVDAGGKFPTAALMKAIITGGARGAAKPNNDQGWGSVDLQETLFPSNRAVKLIDRIPFAANEELTYIIETTNTAPLEVQLVWIDYPSAAGGNESESRLINDLDLKVEAVEGGDGTVLYGNGGSEPDTLNNVEAVRIASAESDKYVITVDCKSIQHGYTEGGAAALYIRGAFDPQATPSVPERVRIKETGAIYMSLDKALLDVTAGQTVEVLQPCKVRTSQTIPVNCTIVATNDDPTATAVSFLPGRTLSVGEDARVCFTNVVFRNESAEPVVLTVVSNGTAAVAGQVGIDEIRTADAKGLELAGPLMSFVSVRCGTAPDWGQKFGKFSCAPSVAGANAAKFKNAFDPELGGIVSGSADLQWEYTPIEPEYATAAAVVDGETEYFVHLHKIFGKYADKQGDILVLKDCELETNVVVKGEWRLLSTNETPMTVSYSESAAIEIDASSSLAVTNLTLTGAGKEGAFFVNGGKLTLESGTVIEDCVNEQDQDVYSGAGAVTVLGGTLTMKSGATIRNCETTHGYGGGVYVESYYADAMFEMTGGSIENCLSSGYGGGAYVSDGAHMTLSGDATLVDSISEIVEGRSDNLYLAATEEFDLRDLGLSLGGELTGLVYLRCGGEDRADNDEPFALIADACSLEAASNSAAFFRSDDNPEKWHGAVGEDGATLVWSDEVVPIPQPPLDYVEARVIYAMDDGTTETNEFATLSEALVSIRDDATVEICEGLTNAAALAQNVVISHDVILRTASGDVEAILRTADVSITVMDGGKLTLSNVALYGEEVGNDAMIRVKEGGELTMDAGSQISEVGGIAQRDSCAVSVENGVFTMKDGSAIRDCSNAWFDEQNLQESPAAGVIVSGERAVFYLQGGEITGCIAYRGGGVLIENSARIEVSGNPRITGNAMVLSGLDPWAVSADLSVAHESAPGEKTGDVILSGEFTGSIGILEPRLYDEDQSLSVDTNVFGRVAEGLDLPALRPSAANFFRDAVPGVTGLIVTNDTEALLVWTSAVDADGIYRDKDGNEYKVVGDPTPTEIDPPTAVTGLIYNGNEQTGVVAADGYTVTDNVKINAGDYTATVTLKDGYVWTGGSTDPLQIDWSIAKATYDMSGVTFTSASLEADGSPKSIYISGDLPAGVSVSYEGNGQTAPGSYTVTAKFTGDAVNYEPIADKTATLTITPKQDPDPDPQWDVITNHPGPLAFKAIERVNDTEWTLVITNRTPYCNYRLIWTTDLTKGFTSTGAWEHAVGPAAEPVWTTNVITTGGAWFWRAEGADGTNMVLRTEE